MDSQEIESKKVWIKVLNIYLGLFLLGYTLAVFNTCAINISWYLSWGSHEEAYINLFSTLIPAGVSIGCLATGPLITKYGRRITYIAAGWLYILGTAILLCPFTVMFGIGRMLTGISAGVFGVLSPIYANEITPETMIGKTGAFIAIHSSAGVIFAYAFGIPLPVSEGSDFNYWWMFMFLFPAAVVVYLFICLAWFIKYDTPQYYASKNMNELVTVALRESYTESGMESGKKRLNADHENTQSKDKAVNVLTIFCDRKYSKMIRIGFIRVAFFQFSGIFTMLFYSTTVFGRIGGSILLSRLLTTGFGVILLVANFLFIPVAKCFSRKVIFIVGDIFLGLLMIAAGVTSSQNVSIGWPIACIMLFTLVFGSTAGSVTWMYLAEILNPQILVVVSMYSWVLQICITLLFPILLSVWNISVLFYIFGVINMMAAVYSAFDMVETKGKLKEDVLNDLNSGKGVKIEEIDNTEKDLKGEFKEETERGDNN